MGRIESLVVKFSPDKAKDAVCQYCKPHVPVPQLFGKIFTGVGRPGCPSNAFADSGLPTEMKGGSRTTPKPLRQVFGRYRRAVKPSTVLSIHERDALTLSGCPHSLPKYVEAPQDATSPPLF